MMAAFIVAVRGTIPQAILLGLSAAFSHSLIIWLLAAIALHFGSQFNAESTEPYFQLASGIIIIALAVWMFWRTRREQVEASHDHSLDGPHGGQLVDIGDGFIEISVFETDVPSRFRLYFYDADHKPKAIDTSVTLKTIRQGTNSQVFTFVSEGDHLESTQELPEPHGGVDLALRDIADGPVTAIVQCKAWKTYNVGVKPVRELFGVMAADGIRFGIFVCCGVYTREAIEWAKFKPMTLISGVELVSRLNNLDSSSRSTLLGEITDGDYTTPTCPSCDVKMVRKKSAFGEFWGCSRYPRCRFKLFLQGNFE